MPAELPLPLVVLIVLPLATLALWALVEPHCLEITRYHLGPSGHWTGAPQRQPRPLPPDSRCSFHSFPAPLDAPERPGLRLVFFTDYHAGLMLAGRDRLLRVMLDARPDVVVFGGDLINGKWDRRRGFQDLAWFGAALYEAGIPFLSIRGNHDKGIDRSAWEDCGLVHLRNERYCLEAGGERWILVGLDDQRLGTPDFAAALEGHAADPARTLVFAHNPDSVLDLKPGCQAQVFCGHFHGGQIRAPFRFEFRHLRSELLSQAGYYGGLYDWLDFRLFISRGTGCVLFPLRFLARPEISIFDIQADSGGSRSHPR
ncbi:MAG: metallophosphoesterase [Bacillota bacterium]|nr:metallophosphoesterase [Bacillota bacterium]